MSFSIADWLPYASPLDPSAEPPSSIDPLGLTTPAEYLADLLVPGFTVRTWRARLLTFDAVAVHVAAAVAKRMNNRDDERTRARLAFERLYVSAVARGEDGKGRQAFSRTLPGIELARAALVKGEKLTKENFLKGQAVNGPIGVTSRLAKNTGVLTAELQLGAAGLDLIAAWSADENLPGITEPESDTPGGRWMKTMIKVVLDTLNDNTWPRDRAQVWDEMFNHLRLDVIGKRENRVLGGLIDKQTARARLFAVLAAPAMKVFAEASGERALLVDGVKSALSRDDAADRRIKAVIEAIDAFEEASALMQQGFDALLWGLRHGPASLETLLAIAQVSTQVDTTLRALPAARARLDAATKNLGDQAIDEAARILATSSLWALCDDMERCAQSPMLLAEGLRQRHKRVQATKRKSVWFDGDRILTLMQQMGVDGDAPPTHTGGYLHPFRVRNCNSLLADLGRAGEAVAA